MDNSDPYNVLLAIATNIPVLLMTGFVLQRHIYKKSGYLTEHFSPCNMIVAQWHLCEIFAVFAHFTCVHVGLFLSEYVAFQRKSHCDSFIFFMNRFNSSFTQKPDILS